MKIHLLPLLPALLLTLAAHAHEFNVSWQIEGDRLTVRATTDDAPAAGAAVELRDPTGRVVARGTLDGTGRFQWPLAPVAGDLHVGVNDGAGHRRTVTVPAAALRAGAGSTDPAAPTEAATDHAPQPPAHPAGHHDGTEPLAVRVLLGLTFLLAGSAAWMGFRNHRRLVELERRARLP